MIEERRDEINSREVFENYVIIKKLKRATKKEVTKAMVEALKGYEVMSITSDNGSEFAGMRSIGKFLKCLVYRCHPYCSWEK